MESTESSNCDLYLVIYVSKAIRTLGQNELLDILRISRERNLRDDISGMLLYKDGIFLQQIEGPTAKIKQLVERLRNDTRHEDLRILIDGWVSRRLFQDWSMAFRNLSGLKSADVPGFSEALGPGFLQELMEVDDPIRRLIALLESPPREALV